MSTGRGAPIDLVSAFQANEGQFSKLYAELTMLGLTANQAKIYLFLLNRPASSVKIISKALDLHRVDVYRKLHELEGFGMVETLLGEPRTYSAMPPKIALATFLRKQEEKLENLRVKAKSLTAELGRYTKSIINRNAESQEVESSYRMIVGRRSYHNEVKTVIRSAKSEILRIISPSAIIRTFYFGVYDEYVKAKKKGVSLRMISEINAENKYYAKRLSKIVELRQLQDIHIRFLVADRATSIISARFDEKSYSPDSSEDTFLIFKDPKLSKSFCFFFEHLWNHAKPLDK